MKISKCFEWPSALCLSALMLQAQETFADGFGATASKQSGDGETNEVEQLKKQMQQMQQQIEMLRRKLEELTKSHAPPLAAATKTDEQKKLEEQLAAELARGATTNATSENVRPSA